MPSGRVACGVVGAITGLCQVVLDMEECVRRIRGQWLLLHGVRHR